MKYYKEINTKKIVIDDEAFDYAIEQIRKNPKDQQEIVDWFFSGNWIEGEC